MMRLAIATRITWNGRLVWVPPTDEPYYVDGPSAESMTHGELIAFWKWYKP